MINTAMVKQTSRRIFLVVTFGRAEAIATAVCKRYVPIASNDLSSIPINHLFFIIVPFPWTTPYILLRDDQVNSRL
jgi:hypothetical protein